MKRTAIEFDNKQLTNGIKEQCKIRSINVLAAFYTFANQVMHEAKSFVRDRMEL
jgi:hypothetical protein